MQYLISVSPVMAKQTEYVLSYISHQGGCHELVPLLSNVHDTTHDTATDGVMPAINTDNRDALYYCYIMCILLSACLNMTSQLYQH